MPPPSVTSSALAALLALTGCERIIGLEHAYAEDSADAETDAGPSAAGCQGQTHAFCADFDTVAKPDDGWTFHTQVGYATGGAFDLDRSSFASAPASLRMAVPAGTPGNDPGFVNRLAWEPAAVAPVASAHAECDLRLNAVDAAELTYVYSVTFTRSGGAAYYLDVLTSRDASFLRELGAGGEISTPLSQALPRGVWTHLELEVTFAAASVVVRVNGSDRLTKSLSDRSATAFQQVSIGPRYYTASAVSATDVSFDNVRVDLR